MSPAAAWVIDQAPIDDQIGQPVRLASSLTGASDEMIAELAAGGGRRFRLLDDDGEVYYVGRLVSADTTPGMGQEFFAPLDDYGLPNAGCTSIEYLVESWVRL